MWAGGDRWVQPQRTRFMELFRRDFEGGRVAVLLAEPRIGDVLDLAGARSCAFCPTVAVVVARLRRQIFEAQSGRRGLRIEDLGTVPAADHCR
jgi:hypothetical protein